MKLISGSGHNRNKGRSSLRRAVSYDEELQTPVNGAPAGGPAHQATGPKKKKGGRGVVIALIVIVALVLSGFAYWKLVIRPPKSEAPSISGEDISNYEVERYYTMLIVGDDQEGGNTDTIMLLRFDTVDMAVNIVSIPRDTLVNTELSNKKINAIYHNLDGIESLMDEVEDIAGFRPNNYAVVNINVFMDVVNAMGGVDFYVPFDMDYDDYADHDKDGVVEYVFTIHIKEGQQTLNGYNALGVFRWRQNNDGAGHTYGNPDIERIDMQHNLLMAIAQKALATRNVVTLTNIAAAVLDQCETDLSLANIGWYITQFMQMDMSNINFFTMPTTGAYINITSYVTINVDDWIDMVNENFNPYGNKITREDCSILYTTTTPALVGGQYYIKSSNLAATNGDEVNQNFR